MTLKIEKKFEGERAVVCVIGRMSAENLPELQRELGATPPPAALDLSDVTLVDLEAVHFLRNAEGKGIELRNCSPFIREWMRREQEISK